MKLKNIKIGFIGAGNISEAIISGMLQKEIKKENIIIDDIDKKRLDFFINKFNVIKAENDFFEKVDIFFIAVKPLNLFKLLEKIKLKINKKHIIISVVAGIKIEKISINLTTNKIIRAMPNIASSICEGMTAIYTDFNNINTNEKNIVEEIFLSIGDFLWIEEEYFDIIGTLNGSGPAYIYRFIESIIDGALELGLPREIAKKTILKTFLGSIKILTNNNKETPRSLSDKVSSPGGTTILALNEMEKKGFSVAIKLGLKKAFKRSIELSNLKK